MTHPSTPSALASAEDPRACADIDAALVRSTVASRLFQRSDLPPRIGRFEVRRKLGAGGMGVVYVAHDAELDRQVAIKLLLLQRGEHDPLERRARLRREAKALARLSHPAIVQVYEVGEHAGHTFVAMELVEGITLSRWVAQAPRAPRDVVAKFVQAGRGLAAAHAAGIVHRDFKPDNAMLGDDGRVRVLDFGLAAAPGISTGAVDLQATDDALEQLTATGSVMGTPAYMAPEQFRGDGADVRSDQFSFAASLFEALFGARPFEGETMQEIAASVLTGRVRFPSGARVSKRLRRALARALSLRPEDRFSSMGGLVDALERAVRPWAKDPRVLGAAIGLVALGSAGAISAARSRADELEAVAIDERTRADDAEELLVRREDALRVGEARLALEHDATLASSLLARLPDESSAWTTDAWSIATEAEAYGIADRVVALPEGYEAMRLAAGGDVALLRRAVDDTWHLWWPSERRTAAIGYQPGLTGGRVEFSDDGRYLVAQDRDGTKRWDTANAEESLLARPGRVAAISGTGRFVVHRSEDDALIVEDTETGAEVFTDIDPSGSTVHVSDDGRHLFVIGGASLRVVDVEGGETRSYPREPCEDEGPFASSETSDFSEPGFLGRNILGVSHDLRRGFFAFSSGTTGALWLVDTANDRQHALVGAPFEDRPRPVAFTPDGRAAAVATWATGRRWSAALQRPYERGEVFLIEIESGSRTTLGTITDAPLDASWSDDGNRLLVTTGEAIHLFDRPSGRVRQLRIDTRTPGHSLVAFAGPNAVATIDATAWRRFEVPRPAPIEPRGVDVTWIAGGSGGRVAWLSESGSVSLWEPGEEPRVLGRHEGARRLAILDEPGAVVTVGEDGVQRFGPGAGWLVREPLPMVHTARLSADGERLAVRVFGNEDQRVAMFDLASGHSTYSPPEAKTVDLWIDAFTPDGLSLVGTRRSGADYEAFRFRTHDAAALVAGAVPPRSALLPHRDGRVLVLSGGPQTRWLSPDGSQERGPVLPIREEDEGLWSLSPDESMLALVTETGAVVLVDMTTGQRALARVGQSTTRLSPAPVAWSVTDEAPSAWFVDGNDVIQHVPLLPRDSRLRDVIADGIDPRADGRPIDWRDVAR